MADKPILFSGPMVRALLAGTKTQTRRTMNPQPELQMNGFYHVHNKHGGLVNVPEEDVGRMAVDYLRISVGDRLYVREAWSGVFGFCNTPPAQRENVMTPDGPLVREDVWFWADGNPDGGDYEKPRPGMHMPRWASRLTLTVTDVRVERLQDCSVADAIAEGIRGNEHEGWFDYSPGERLCDFLVDPRQSYCTLWNSINGDGAWEANPWVAAYTFTVELGNIDKLASAA